MSKEEIIKYIKSHPKATINELSLKFVEPVFLVEKHIKQAKEEK